MKLLVGADPELFVSDNGKLVRSEEHTSELQSRPHLVCRLLLEKKKTREEPSDCGGPMRASPLPLHEDPLLATSPRRRPRPILPAHTPPCAGRRAGRIEHTCVSH